MAVWLFASVIRGQVIPGVHRPHNRKHCSGDGWIPTYPSKNTLVNYRERMGQPGKLSVIAADAGYDLGFGNRPFPFLLLRDCKKSLYSFWTLRLGLGLWQVGRTMIHGPIHSKVEGFF